jgi:hypothetical protein
MFGRHGNHVFTQGFFADEGLDFETRIALGQCASGAADAGEVLSTIARVTDEGSWFREFGATAARVQAGAEASAKRGHPVSAGSAYLRGAGYWAMAMDGLVGADDGAALTKTFRAHRDCWDGFIEASQSRFVPVSVPYEGTMLPGWLLRPDDSGRPRPTLVMTNGSDGPISSLWATGAASALERGWNVFVYDGPGQQSLLFERGVPFRHDWEAVLTPVVDALFERPDVDAARLTAYGISQAGYWLPRALAFEHRFVAAVADPGVVDVSTSWTEHLPKNMIKMLDEGDRAAFDRNMGIALKMPSLRRQMTFRARPYQHDDLFDLFTEVRRYDLTAVAGDIRTPLMICNPEGEQFWPGQSERLAALVSTSHLVGFTAAEGANFHCQPMARLLTHERMFDWLDEQTALNLDDA